MRHTRWKNQVGNVCVRRPEPTTPLCTTHLMLYSVLLLMNVRHAPHTFPVRRRPGQTHDFVCVCFVSARVRAWAHTTIAITRARLAAAAAAERVFFRCVSGLWNTMASSSAGNNHIMFAA